MTAYQKLISLTRTAPAHGKLAYGKLGQRRIGAGGDAGVELGRGMGPVFGGVDDVVDDLGREVPRGAQHGPEDEHVNHARLKEESGSAASRSCGIGPFHVVAVVVVVVVVFVVALAVVGDELA